MDYLTARNVIRTELTNSKYQSADYYRMTGSKVIALFLTDKEHSIITDLITHGSDADRERLNAAVESGYITTTSYTDDFGNATPIIYEISADIKNACKIGKAHLAMQIAFPEPYLEFTGGTQMWSVEDPKYRELLFEAYGLKTNAPTDFLGNHLPYNKTDNKRPVGRPKLEEHEKKAKPKIQGYQQWVEACQLHAQRVKEASTLHLLASDNKSKQVNQANVWLDSVIQPLSHQVLEFEVQSKQLEVKIKQLQLEAKQVVVQAKQTKLEIKQFKTQYRLGIEELSLKVTRARQVVTDAKVTPKPLKSDYVK